MIKFHKSDIKNTIVCLFAVLLLMGIIGCGGDKNGTPKFKVERIIDGDTIVLQDGRTVRYIGIDTPERGDPYYSEATEANRNLVEGEKVKLVLDVEEKDRYGRTLAYVYVDDTFVNVELVRMGYARAYPYPPNIKHKDVFSKAENEARREGVGIWSSRLKGHEIDITEVSFDPEGDDRNNLNGEWVVIIGNTNDSINMNGFTLSDDSGHVYSFENFTLPARGTVKIFTGAGDNTTTSLYWGSNMPIWNNDSDTAFLRNPEGLLIAEYSY